MKTLLSIKGTLTFEPADPPRTLGKYVYQRVQPGLGNVASDPSKSLQLRAHTIPTDPQTAPQLARRAVFSNAVAAWQALSEAEKNSYAPEAAKRGLPAYQFFLSRYLRNGST
jgi:hypothetical protein